MTELPKTFEPGPIEARWYLHWETSGLFRPERPDAEPFTIVMPPPNVTGSLHIGHALDNTLQDILVRRARMQGKDALWVVGTDHAGIATQMVVERQLDLEQKTRADLGREKFIERVWEWKKESGGQITQQLRRLGASCDWANERFTMDKGFSKAVTHVFVELHKRGLIYRDKRLVNWDPKFQTAISDLEVETRDSPGKFWTLRYPLAEVQLPCRGRAGVSRHHRTGHPGAGFARAGGWSVPTRHCLTVAETRSTCPYCGVGCGVVIQSQGAQITGVRGDPDHPANFGRLCTKGQSLHLTASATITLHQRPRTPQLHGREVGWDEALEHAADRFAAIVHKHGADAVGFYITPSACSSQAAIRRGPTPRCGGASKTPGRPIRS